MSISKITKAVIPCAGFGTRFLPITKVMPKEILPIIDTPALQLIVDEAVSSGMTEILIIISPQKDCIVKLFEKNVSLNDWLLSTKRDIEYQIANHDFGASISFVVQETMNGNGNAIKLAKDFACGEPFAVLFGDDLMYTGKGVPVAKQLADAYLLTGKSVVGCQCATEEVARRCGVMIVGESVGKITEVKGIVEKPQKELPSRLVSLGRFVVSPEIFEALEQTHPTKDGELYMIDALSLLARVGKVVAYEFDGRRYDIGNKQGYLEATVEYALRDEKLKEQFRKYLSELQF